MSGHGNSRRSEKARLTAGLKCAPEIGPNVRINTAKIAPVGSVLHNSASAPLPPASRCAMIPEPTTAASRNAVPSDSAARRFGREKDFSFIWLPLEEKRTSRSFGCLGRIRCSVLVLADSVQLLLQRERAKRFHRQTDKNIDAVRDHAHSVSERQTHFRLGPNFGGGIGQTPMGSHRLSRPNRTCLCGGIVAEGKCKIEFRCVRAGELGPAFRADLTDVVVQPFQEIDGIGMHMAPWLASS